MAQASNITMRVTSQVVGYAITQNYQSQADQDFYLVPTYLMTLGWTEPCKGGTRSLSQNALHFCEGAV